MRMRSRNRRARDRDPAQHDAIRGGSRWRWIPALALLVLLLPAGAIAQESSGSASRGDSRWSVRGSVGMTGGPETFNMTFEAPWRAQDLVSVGPLFQLGFSDDNVLVAGTVQAYLTPTLTGQASDWHPYASAGAGFIYLEDDDRRFGRDEEDGAFLMTFGAGIEYAFSEDFYMGTGLLFNAIPAGAVGERFVFGWQALTFRYAF